MIYQLIRQARLIVSDQRNAIFPGNIFRRYDNKFIPIDSRTECDLLDPPPWYLAANRGSEKHVGQNHIVDVAGPSGHFVAPLFSRDRVTDDGIVVHILKSAEAWARGWDSVSQTGSARESKCCRSGSELYIRSIFPPARLAGKLTIGKNRIPSQIGCLHHAAQGFSQVRGNQMPVVQSLLRHNKFAIRVKHNEIRIASCGNSALAPFATS